MIRVLIVASSPVAKAGLESLVSGNPSFSVVGFPSDDPDAAESAIAELRPDVVLAELESRDDENASVLLEEAANGASVILLVHGSPSDWADALQQGVKAVLPTSMTGAQVAAAIEAAAAGLGIFYPSEVENLFRSQRMNESLETLPEPLTPREIEVLRLLAEGLGNKEIASRLAISEHTVKFHVASIMGKLGAASRTEAVTLGIRRGIVLI
ncbi:MAG TPA: response regulator transcription factor [Candidatus Acidoferrales bacterium]|jgi:DNA-binding NarL/FixJ family response regulator|nr:response regulator transcription factor [Candidatus Acidoferrales bacterium]